MKKLVFHFYFKVAERRYFLHALAASQQKHGNTKKKVASGYWFYFTSYGFILGYLPGFSVKLKPKFRP